MHINTQSIIWKGVEKRKKRFSALLSFFIITTYIDTHLFYLFWEQKSGIDREEEQLKSLEDLSLPFYFSFDLCIPNFHYIYFFSSYVFFYYI